MHRCAICLHVQRIISVCMSAEDKTRRRWLVNWLQPLSVALSSFLRHNCDVLHRYCLFTRFLCRSVAFGYGVYVNSLFVVCEFALDLVSNIIELQIYTDPDISK